MPDPRIKIKKSAGIKKQERKGNYTPASKKSFKIKVKSADPQRDTGGFTKMTKTEITEKKAARLQARSPRKDAENAGKLVQNINKIAKKPVQRYSATKVVAGKSNLNLPGKVVKLVAGKAGVGRLEGKFKGNQFEKATTTTQKFVTSAKKDNPITPPVKPKFQPTKETPVPKLADIKKEEEESSKKPTTRVDSGPTLPKKKKRVPTVSQSYSNGKMSGVKYNK